MKGSKKKLIKTLIISLIVVVLSTTAIYQQHYWILFFKSPVFYFLLWVGIFIYLSALLSVFSSHGFTVKKSYSYRLTWPISLLIFNLGQKLQPGYKWYQTFKTVINFFIISALLLLIVVLFSIFFYFYDLIHLAILLIIAIILSLADKHLLLKKRYLEWKMKNQETKKVLNHEQGLQKKLRELSLFTLCEGCIQNKLDKKLNSIYLTVLKNRLDNGEMLNQIDKRIIAQKIGSLSTSECQEVLTVMIGLFTPLDWELTLTTRGIWQPIYDLPILFKFSSQKKEIIECYLSGNIQTDALYSVTKKEFRKSFYIPRIISLINALEFSYKKDWDEQEIKKLAKKMNDLFALIALMIPEIWDAKEKELLQNFLETSRENFKRKGIIINIP